MRLMTPAMLRYGAAVTCWVVVLVVLVVLSPSDDMIKQQNDRQYCIVITLSGINHGSVNITSSSFLLNLQ
jgi:hypothetical protein